MSDVPTTSLSLDQCSAWVEVAGKRAPVYNTKSDGPNKVTGFIESQEGVSFTVHLRDDFVALPYGLKKTLFVDGVKRKAYVSQPYCGRRLLGDPLRISNYTGQRESEVSERPFLFSKVSVTEDEDEAPITETALKQMGTIRLELRRITDIQQTNHTTYPALPGTTTVHEKTKKAASHQTALGERKAAPLETRFSTSKEYDVAEPYRHFEFKYLSRALLELFGHKPAEEEPEPDAAAVSPSPPPPDRVAAATPAIAGRAPAAESKPKIRRGEVLVISDDDDDDKDVKPARKKVKAERVAGGSGGQDVKVKKEKREVLILD